MFICNLCGEISFLGCGWLCRMWYILYGVVGGRVLGVGGVCEMF